MFACFGERQPEPPAEEDEEASSDSASSTGVVVGSVVGCAAFAALAGGAWYKMKPTDAGGGAKGTGKDAFLVGEEIRAGREALLQNEV